MAAKREKTDRGGTRPRCTRHRAPKRAVQTDLFAVHELGSRETSCEPASHSGRVVARRSAENGGNDDGPDWGDRS
jgi:hypothetical protein